MPLGDSNTSVCLAEHSCDLQANGTRLGDVVPVARYPGFQLWRKVGENPSRILCVIGCYHDIVAKCETGCCVVY